MANQNPTYPLDRRVLEIILQLTETSITLAPAAHGADRVYEEIRQKVSQLAWDSVHKTTDIRPDKPEGEFKVFDRNTWKRIFGHANLKQGPNPTRASEDVLKQIALFVGYDSWEGLMENLEEEYQRIVAEHNSPRFVRSRIVTRNMNIRVGDRFYVEWKKYKGGIAWMKVVYEKDGRFKIVSKGNCSLASFDTFETNCLLLGGPLYLKNLFRNGKLLGDYSGSGYTTKIEQLS